jgi:hypothetical protein
VLAKKAVMLLVTLATLGGKRLSLHDRAEGLLSRRIPVS